MYNDILPDFSEANFDKLRECADKIRPKMKDCLKIRRNPDEAKSLVDLCRYTDYSKHFIVFIILF